MMKTTNPLATVLVLALTTLPLSIALAQQAQIPTVIKITTFLADAETTIDRIPLPIGGIMTLERAIQYPDIARRAGLEGRVIAKTTIDTVGNVTNVKIYYSDAEVLHDAVIQGLSGCRFRPGLRRGRPVDVVMTVVTMFSLHDVIDPCATDSSRIVEIVLDHRNEYDLQGSRTIVLRDDGTALFDGYLCRQPIDTSSIFSISIRIPDDWVHAVNGGFNPLDFRKLCALLQRVVLRDGSSGQQRIPSAVPYETLTIVTLDGKHKVLVNLGDDPDFWSVARAIDCIGTQIRWYESWPNPAKE